MDPKPLFPVLRDELLAAIAARGNVRRYPAGTVLITEGDRSDLLYIVLEGRVRVYSSNDDGKEVTIVTHGAGEYVGEMALDGGVRSASVMTLEPTTCAVVSGSELRHFMATHPEFAQNLVLKLIWRVRQATDNIKSLALQDVYGRVTRLLDELAEPQGSVRVVRERLTQREIAERVGSSREMVSRIFKDLVEAGCLDVSPGRIAILKKLPARW
ncbi:MAG TPA: Crp/Fnr family transcriptional regulator [Caldimonas sp.]|nr:Crp/Fnr family transcriptional regulator [Caldimonas sp.]